MVSARVVVVVVVRIFCTAFVYIYQKGSVYIKVGNILCFWVCVGVFFLLFYVLCVFFIFVFLLILFFSYLVLEVNGYVFFLGGGLVTLILFHLHIK